MSATGIPGDKSNMTQPEGMKARLARYLSALANGGVEERPVDRIAEGLAAFGRGDVAIAAEHLRAGLVEKPDHLEARLTYARIALAAKDLAEAEARIWTAVQMHGRSAAVHTLYGEVLHALRRHEKADSCFRVAIGLDAKFVEAHVRLGVLQFEMGNLAEALLTLEHAIFLNRKDANARYYIAQICLEYEDFKRALIQSHWAEKSDPSFRPIYLLRADIFEHLGDWRNASAEFYKLAEMGMADADVYCRLGVAQLKLNASEAAQNAFEKAIELEWHRLEARYHLARLHEEQQHFDFALRGYKLLLDSKTYSEAAREAITRIEKQLAQIDTHLTGDATISAAADAIAPTRPAKPKLSDLVGQRPGTKPLRPSRPVIPPPPVAKPQDEPLPDARSQMLQMQLVMAMFLEMQKQQGGDNPGPTTEPEAP
jgi:tetratricopeptide (TPR) repeat protein